MPLTSVKMSYKLNKFKLIVQSFCNLIDLGQYRLNVFSNFRRRFIRVCKFFQIFKDFISLAENILIYTFYQFL